VIRAILLGMLVGIFNGILMWVREKLFELQSQYVPC
jgi:hypothetical protein